MLHSPMKLAIEMADCSCLHESLQVYSFLLNLHLAASTKLHVVLQLMLHTLLLLWTEEHTIASYFAM